MDLMTTYWEFYTLATPTPTQKDKEQYRFQTK